MCQKSELDHPHSSQEVHPLEELTFIRFLVDFQNSHMSMSDGLSHRHKVDFSGAWCPVVIEAVGVMDVNANKHGAIGSQQCTGLEQAKSLIDVGMAYIVPVADGSSGEVS